MMSNSPHLHPNNHLIGGDESTSSGNNSNNSNFNLSPNTSNIISIIPAVVSCDNNSHQSSLKALHNCSTKPNSGGSGGGSGSSSIIAADVSTINVVRRSSKRTSGKQSHLLEIHTSCCSLSISFTKILTLSVLILNCIAFLVLLALLIGVYVKKTEQNVLNVTTRRGEAMLYSEILSSSLRVAAYSPYQNVTSLYITRYETYYPKLVQVTSDITKMIDESERVKIWNESFVGIEEEQSLKDEKRALQAIKNGHINQAIDIIDSENYKSERLKLLDEIQSYTNYLSAIELLKDEDVKARALTSLIVVSAMMAIILPVVILTLIASFSRERQHLQNIARAQAIMLMDTMTDPSLKELFKKHCESEYSLENYELLQKINEFKKLCETSFEIQLDIYDGGDQMSSTSSNGATNSSSKSNSREEKRKPYYTEKDLEMIENRKKELAKTIHTLFLSVEGKMSVNINKKIADHILQEINDAGLLLSDNLFDNVEREIMIVMSDTHKRFKESVAFQKKMKLDTIRKKINKSNNNK